MHMYFLKYDVCCILIHIFKYFFISHVLTKQCSNVIAIFRRGGLHLSIAQIPHNPITTTDKYADAVYQLRGSEKEDT